MQLLTGDLICRLESVASFLFLKLHNYHLSPEMS